MAGSRRSRTSLRADIYECVSNPSRSVSLKVPSSPHAASGFSYDETNIGQTMVYVARHLVVSAAAALLTHTESSTMARESEPKGCYVLMLDSKASSDCYERQWLVRIQRGDVQAFEALYKAYRIRVQRFVKRFIKGPEALEEIVNDTFMVVWVNANEFRGESRISTWIFGIAYRLSMKALRRNRRSRWLVELSDNSEIAIDPSMDLEMKDWLERAMRSMAPEQRDTLQLAYRYGYSIEEISHRLARPTGTIKSRLFHGRAILRSRALAHEGGTTSSQACMSRLLHPKSELCRAQQD